MDKKNFKKQSVNNWSLNPCGSNYVKECIKNKNIGDITFDNLSESYFRDVMLERYKRQPWLLKDIHSFNINGKKVLEIGFGMGTDHLQLAKIGGVMYGIDITPTSKKITEQLFNTYGYCSELIIGDVESMPYKDKTFDFVYSFGVIHHTPNMRKAINEIYRVLKPRGKCYIAVYNRDSWFFWHDIFLKNYILNGDYKKFTLEQKLSMIEYPNNNPNLLVKLSTKKEIKDIFYKFSNIKIMTNHLTDLGIWDSIFNQSLKKYLAKKIGWFIIIQAQKSNKNYN